MQPLYLKIRGFGPFLNAEIPRETFEIINKERLFLVSGEIGAGKTTLFDAIVFALFGETSFPERSPADLISHLLPPNSSTPPEVVFEFLLQNRVYRIVRRHKFGSLPSSLSLWVDNKLTSSNAKEADAIIRELFGLAGPQFKKVFIIPQGEYRRILLAKPEEKKALFEHLFDTKILTDLQKYLENSLKEKEAELKGLIEREKELFKLAEVSSLEELKEKLITAERKKEQLTAELNIVSGTLRKTEEELKDLETIIKLLEEKQRTEKELKVLEQSRAKIEELRTRIHLLRKLKEREFHLERLKELKIDINKKIKEKKHLQANLSSLSQSLTSLEDRLKTLHQKEEKIERLKEEIPILKAHLETLRRKEALEKELSILKKKGLDLELSLESINKNEEAKLKELEGLIEEMRRFQRFRELKRELEKVEEELHLYEEYSQKREAFSSLSNRLSQLVKERDYLKGKLEKLEESELATILAQKLKKGEPCPVCGSPVHPKKATPSLWQRALIEDYRTKLTQKEEELRSTEEELHKIKGKLEFLESKLKEDRTVLLKKKQALEGELSTLSIQPFRFSDLSQYEKRERELKLELKGIQHEREILREQIERLRANQASLEGQLQELLQTNIIRKLDPTTLREEIRRREQAIEIFLRQKEEALKQYLELVKQKQHIETLISSYELHLSEIIEDYKKSFIEILKLIRDGYFTSFKEIISSWKDLKNLYLYEEEINSFEERHRRIVHRLEMLQKELEKFKFVTDEDIFEEYSVRYQELYKRKEDLEREKEWLNKELGGVERFLSHLSMIENNLLEISSLRKKLDEEYSLLKGITEILSGKVRGVSFHSYVLSRFLSFILRRANFYFREFTSGRFTFVEGEIFTKGFILEVFDAYTGRKREIKTLSGGESFLASLAFALGTSDVLLRLSQKPPLETILIDEGFGSLDEASLMKVTETLVNISQRSGKIIGLISHLREMRERIPVVIEVVKTESRGSIIQRVMRNY